MKKNLQNRIKNILMKMMINCEQATYLVDKQQYTSLGFKETFDLKLHLMTCKHCRLYKVESHLMTGNISKMLSSTREELKLSEEQKKKILERIEKES